MIRLDGSTHPCRATWCGGGVARNMADALNKLGARPRLLAMVGDDQDGRLLAETVPGLLGEGCVTNARTAHYTAVLDSSGECRLGLGDMAIHNTLTPQIVERNMALVEAAPLIVLDGNVPQHTMEYVLTLANSMGKPVFFEPTDIRKAAKPFLKHHKVAFASPNINELRVMAHALSNKEIKYSVQSINNNKSLSEALSLVPYVMEHVEYLIVTLGESGVLIVKYKSESDSNSNNKSLFWDERYDNNSNELTASLYPVVPLRNIQSVSGAGDCLASGFIFGLLSGFNECRCIAVGFETAKAALYSENTVPHSFSKFNILNTSDCVPVSVLF